MKIEEVAEKYFPYGEGMIGRREKWETDCEREAFKKGCNYMLDKVINWLKTEADNYVYVEEGLHTLLDDEFYRIFKSEMEK